MPVTSVPTYERDSLILIHSSDDRPHCSVLILTSYSAAYLVALLQYNLIAYIATR